MTRSIQGIAAIVLLVLFAGSTPAAHEAGEAFFEPPGSEHLVSENASTTEPASLLAIFVADDGAQLTMFEKK